MTTEVGVNWALKFADEVSNAAGCFAVEVASMCCLHMVAGGIYVPAILPIRCDHANVVVTSDLELIDLAFAIGNAPDVADES